MSEDFSVQFAELRPGSMLAEYRLEAQIGAGGMAVVFRARDERLGRRVALKVLAPALTSDAAFRRRFMAESRAAAAVDDPHIIPVYEAGEAGGVLFIAMRFVAKRSPEFSASYAVIAAKRGKKIATIAIARKLLTRAWHLLSEMEAAEASAPLRRP